MTIDLEKIDAPIRKRAAVLAQLYHDGWRSYPSSWEHSAPAEAIERDAEGLMQEASEILLGDAEALGETRDTLAERITYHEALDVLCNYPDAVDVPRWLAAAAAVVEA